MSEFKEYIGDGVYADLSGNMLVITTEDGIRATNTIYFEPDVWDSLVKYVERMKEPEPEIDEPLRLDRDRQLVEEARERERSV